MIDTKTIGIIVAAVVAVVVVLYIYDRRTKQQAVDMLDAAKLAVGAGAIAGGVTYAVGGDGLPDVVESIEKGSELVQEIFTGKPEF
jgi:Flp pilus assembly protein TadB